MNFQKNKVFCMTCQKTTYISNAIQILSVGDISGQFLKSKYCKDCKTDQLKGQPKARNPFFKG